MADIHITFINNSNDANNSSVVIFQQNVAASFDEIAVAWTVIENSAQGQQTPIVFPTDLQIAVVDGRGNRSAPIAAQPGQAFVMRAPTGPQPAPDPAAPDPDEICLFNALPVGAITVEIYRAGRLLATQTGVPPQQTAAFKFSHSLWVGPSHQVTQGQVLNSADLAKVNTELSLLGVASANIVMSGGGAGPTATPFTFTLQPTPPSTT